MKEKYRAFKEWRKNPRHNALFQLLCWFIFFGTLYLLACSGVFSPKYRSRNRDDNSGKITNDSVENYINMSSYEYEYNIKYDDNEVNVNGIFYDNKYYFTIEDKKYYDDGILYLVDEENKKLIPEPIIDLPIQLNRINREATYVWLSESTVYETITYKDGSRITTYIYSPTEEYDIKLVATESEHLINLLEMDLTNFLNSIGSPCNSFYVNIKFTNINNISSYDKNYDEYEKELLIVEEQTQNEENTIIEEVN